MNTFWKVFLLVAGFVFLDLLLAAGLIFFAWKYVAPYEAHKMVRLAEPLVLKGQYAQARQDYDLALLLTPYDTATRFERGVMEWHLGQATKALADINPYVEAHPTNVRALIQRGLVKSYLGDQSGAIEDFSRAITEQPGNFDALRDRGYSKIMQKDYPGAGADLDAALEISPGDSWTSVQRAYVRIKLKNYDGAIDDCNKALKYYPHYSLALEYRGLAREKKGDYATALMDFDLAIKIHPSIFGYEWRGWVKICIDDLNGAISDFNQVIRMNPKYASGYYLRGIAYRRDGDPMLSESDFTKLLELDPSSSAAHFGRAITRYILEEKGGAESDWRECLNSDTVNRPYSEFWLWILMNEQGKKAAADQELASFMGNYKKARPNQWENHIGDFLLGKITVEALVSLAENDQTELESKKANRLCEAWFYAGKVAQIQGDAATARKDFANAIATGIKDRVEYSEAKRELAKQ